MLQLNDDDFENIGSMNDIPTGIMTNDECEGINGNRPTVYDSEETVQTLVSDNDDFGMEQSNAEYHGSGRVGSTMLGILMDNALKYKMIIDKTIKFESEAFDMGSVLHTMILEPEKCDEVFIVEDLEISRKVKIVANDDRKYIEIPDDYLTAGGRLSTRPEIQDDYELFKEAHKDKIILSAKDIKMLDYLKSTEHLIRLTNEKKEGLEIAMENTKQLKDFQECVNNGHKEKVFHATINGVDVQVKPDLFYAPDDSKPKEIVIIDLKTTAKEATNEEFLKSSASFNYFGQEALYTRAIEENGFKVLAFYFGYSSRLVFGGASYQSHQEADKELGRVWLNKALQKYKYCHENDLFLVNNFNGRDYDFIGNGALPSYVHYKYNNQGE